MPRYLIEVAHSPDKHSCLETMEVFRQTGSHFFTHAEWGCLDGEHKAWMIVEASDKEEAMQIVPPLYRSEAKVIRLTTFTADDIMETDKIHENS
jgi:hypothetical protein